MRWPGLRGLALTLLVWALAGTLWAQAGLPETYQEGPTAETPIPGLFPARPGANLITVTTGLEPAAPPTEGEYTLLVQVVLAPGLHLYRDRIRFEWTELRGVGQPRLSLPPARQMPVPGGAADGGSVAVYDGEVTLRLTLPVTGKPGEPLSIKGTFYYQTCTDRLCYPPASLPVALSATIGPPGEPATATTAPAAPPPSGPAIQAEAAPEGEAGFTALKWVAALLGAFGAGVLLSLTPCVYPMLPIIAAVVAGAVSRKGPEATGGARVPRALGASLTYVLGLSVVYALLGLAAASAGGALRGWLQSAAVRIPTSAVFVLLALVTFQVVWSGGGFGAASWFRGLGARGGYPGLFLIGGVSGLVAAPCVSAPLVALLVQIARTGDRWLGFWTLFSLSWGMGLLLVLAGTFSAAVLPRAGAWMYRVRNLLGFVMLWAAVWVLRPVLGASLYNLSVGLVVVAAAVYLGGLDALAPGSGLTARTRRFVGLVAAAVGMVYLVVGLAGLLGLGTDLGTEDTGGPPQQQGIPFVESDAQALEAALGSGRPVLVDFYAEWCVLCEELDRTTFRDPEVVQAASAFVVLKVDFDRNPDLVSRFGVVGVPMVLLFGPGEETPRRTFVGAITAEALLKGLRQVRSDEPVGRRRAPPGADQ